MSRPARGTECVSCRALGHRCEAVLYAALEPDGPELAVCLPCADGEPCVALRCAGRGREGSAVQMERDVYGDVQEPGFVGPVVERTPEELGLPRVVPDAPAPRPVRTVSPDHGVRQPRSTISERRLRRDRPEVGERKTMGRGVWLTEERKREIVEASDTMESQEVARRFGVGESTVSNLRSEAGRPPKPRGGARAKAWRESKAAAQTATAAAVVTVTGISSVRLGAPEAPRPVEIDPQRPGTMDALLGAQERQDARAETLTVQLTREQVAEIVRGLTPAQMSAMIAAGLPAALALRG